MSRFYYTHFNIDISHKVEKEYNRMLRHEKYIQESEAKYIVRTSHKQMENYPDPETLPNKILEQEQFKLQRKRIDLLYIALIKLKFDFPQGYVLIKDYYFGDKKITQYDLSQKYGVTINVIRYRLKISKIMLREIITKYEA